MLRAFGVLGLLPILVGCQTLLGIDGGDPRNDGGGGVGGSAGGGGDIGGSGGDGTGGAAGGGLPGFATPTIVSELAGGANTDDPTVTADLLTMFFNRGSDIHYTARSSTNEPWPSGNLVMSLSTAADETNCRLSPDGLLISFGRTPSSGVDSFVYFSQRSDGEPDAWATPEEITELNVQTLDTHVGSVTSDELYMLLERKLGTDNWHIYESRRSDTDDNWGSVDHVPELDVGNLNSRQPWLTANGLRVYFDAGNQSEGNIFTATRESIDAPFSTPVPLDSVNTPDIESDAWLSPDESYIVFSRRTESDPNNDIWEARRTSTE